MLSENNENDSVAGLTATQLSARQNLEKYLAKKAEDILNKSTRRWPIRRARVSADIISTRSRASRRSLIPKARFPAPRRLRKTPPTPFLRSPAAAHPERGEWFDGDNAAAVPTNSSKMRKKVTNNSYEINKTISNIMQTPGSMKRVSAAVFIAANVTGSGTNRVVAARTPEEMQKIKRVVQGALGIQEARKPAGPTRSPLRKCHSTKTPRSRSPSNSTSSRRNKSGGISPRPAFTRCSAVWCCSCSGAFSKSTPMENIPLGVPLGAVAMAGDCVR